MKILTHLLAVKNLFFKNQEREDFYTCRINNIYNNPAHSMPYIVQTDSFPKFELGMKKKEVRQIMGKANFETTVPVSVATKADVFFYKRIVGDSRYLLQLHYINNSLHYANFSFESVLQQERVMKYVSELMRNLNFKQYLSDFKDYNKGYFDIVNQEGIISIKNHASTEISFYKNNSSYGAGIITQAV
ncbi:MAG: hypothetical protein ABI921_02100 [Panacibacter sp.]